MTKKSKSARAPRGSLREQLRHAHMQIDALRSEVLERRDAMLKLAQAEHAESGSAAKVLNAARATIAQRADQRDLPNGERSMARCVAAFNILYGTTLTEVQGWTFMQMLKVSRASAGALNMDDYVDGVAYAALAGEAAARRAKGGAA